MLGRFSNFGKRAEAADDLVRLVMHWKLRKIIKPGHADHLLKVLARDFGIYEIIPPKQPRPLSAKHVAYLKEEIRNGKRKLAGLPGTETNPSPKIPGGLPEPVTKKRTLRIVSG